jgi:hypothetical protein
VATAVKVGVLAIVAGLAFGFAGRSGSGFNSSGAPRVQRFCEDNPARCIGPSPLAAAQGKRSRPRSQTARQREVFGDRMLWRNHSLPTHGPAPPIRIGQKNSTRHLTEAPIAEMVNPGSLLGRVISSTKPDWNGKGRLLWLRADTGLLDDRPPFVDLGFLETRKAFRCLLFA